MTDQQSTHADDCEWWAGKYGCGCTCGADQSTDPGVTPETLLRLLRAVGLSSGDAQRAIRAALDAGRLRLGAGMQLYIEGTAHD